VGDRLYQKGIKKLEERERVCKQAKKQKKAETIKAATFKPHINQYYSTHNVFVSSFFQFFFSSFLKAWKEI
jgi:hypothetical protein